MPYVAIKAYPKDEEAVKQVVDRINDILLETFGCPQKAVNISYEEVAPEDWDDKVREPEILAKTDRMMIMDGEKKY